jgi:peptide deformylase
VEGSETTLFFEGCLSIPGLRGIVPRARCVRASYLNERAEIVEVHAKGCYARILQHETDHISGILYTDRVIPQTLMTGKSYDTYWKDRLPREIVKEIS